MGNLKSMVKKEVAALGEGLDVGSEVIVSQAGARKQGSIIKVKNDRSGAQVKSGKGLALWYAADVIHAASSTAKASASKASANVATQGEAVAPVKSAKNASKAQKEKAVKKAVKKQQARNEKIAADKVVKDTEKNAAQDTKQKVPMTAKQSEMFTLLKKNKTLTAPEIADKMNLTQLETVKLGATLLSAGYATGSIDAGIASYTLSKRGKELQLGDIELPVVKKSRGEKTQLVIDLINAGEKVKTITQRVGCDPSHVSHIKSMLFIQAENAKPENKKLTNEQFSEKIGKTMYLVNLFRK